MNGPGEILLIACYELGHQPLAVAWPAAFLERAGYAPAVMDLAVEPFDAEKVARARVVAISVPMHTALRLGVRTAARVRAANPAARILFYGLYAALNAGYLRARCGADAVLAGEIEQDLVEAVRRLGAGEVARDAVTLAKLAFAAPSRAALPSLKKYAHVERDGRLELAGHVEASRGCKHLCRHCPIPPVYGGRFFVVPVDVVLADIRQQVAAGARHVTFGDPDFLNGPRHALAVARALHAEFPDVTFDVTAKVEHLLRHREHLPELAACGCAFVVTAAESLDDAVLRRLAKGHTRADVEEALRRLRDAGISPRPTWVAFTPWTTLDGYREWLAFIAGEGLVDSVDPVQYGIRLLVPPGSLLADHEAMRPFLGPLVEDDFYYRWTHPDPRMDDVQRDVTALVAARAAAEEDPAVTLERLRCLAAGRAGRAALAAFRLPPPERPIPARLTEPWFC